MKNTKKVIASPNEKMEIKQEIMKPLSDDDIRSFLGKDFTILKYSKLKKFKNIDQILPTNYSTAIILYEHRPNEGHWCAISKYPDKKNKNKSIIELFDPYGNRDRDIVKWNDKDTNKMLGVGHNYLTELFHNSPHTPIHNDFKYQATGDDINSCGKHCVFRLCMLLKHNLALKDYEKFMKKLKKPTNLNYDEIVSTLV